MAATLGVGPCSYSNHELCAFLTGNIAPPTEKCQSKGCSYFLHHCCQTEAEAKYGIELGLRKICFDCLKVEAALQGCEIEVEIDDSGDRKLPAVDLPDDNKIKAQEEEDMEAAIRASMRDVKADLTTPSAPKLTTPPVMKVRPYNELFYMCAYLFTCVLCCLHLMIHSIYFFRCISSHRFRLQKLRLRT